MVHAEQEDERLLELALHLETRAKPYERLDYLESSLTPRLAWPTLWAIAARGFFSAQVLQEELPHLASDVQNAGPTEIVSVLTHVPAQVVTAVGEPRLLQDYPLALDALLMHAAHRAPDALAAAGERLPENVRRALPFVRRRLGLEPPSHLPELFADLVETHVTTWGAGDLWVLHEERLVAEPLERIDQVTALAALLAPGASLQDAIVAAASGRERDLSQGWRLAPFHARATTAQVFAMLAGRHIDHEQQLLMFASRSDAPEALLSLLERERALDGSLIEWLAVVIARRMQEEGKPVPVELDALVDFQCAPRMFNHPAWEPYVAGLRAFPRDRLLARVDALAASDDEDAREDSVVGLRAYLDVGRLEQAARDPERARVLGSVGHAAIPVLRAVLRSAAPDSDLALYLRASITNAMVAAPEIDPDWDELVSTDSSQFSGVVARLPPARRDAVVRARLDDERAERITAVLHLLGDDALKEALASLLARERLPRVGHAFARLGARATRPLVEALAGLPKARVREVVDQSRLSDEVADRLLGGQKHRPLPLVRGSIADGAPFLALVEPHLRAAEPVGRIHLTGERIAIGDYTVEDRSVLDRKVPAGDHPVTVYYKDVSPQRLEGLATAGLEAIQLRFSEAATVSWVEARNEAGEAVLGQDELSFWLADEERVGEDPEASNASLQEATEDSYAGGYALTELGGDKEEELGAVVVYIGESCRSTRAFWGLDAGGAPAVLIAAFQYSPDLV